MTAVSPPERARSASGPASSAPAGGDAARELERERLCLAVVAADERVLVRGASAAPSVDAASEWRPGDHGAFELSLDPLRERRHFC